MPKCGKIGAASTAGWGAGAAIFSPVGRVVLLQKGGPIKRLLRFKPLLLIQACPTNSSTKCVNYFITQDFDWNWAVLLE